MHSSASPAMSAPNREAHSSSDLPIRQGALSAEAIGAQWPQFRILIIGKANAGKTTILRKVCNAEPDEKPVIYDAKGRKVKRNLADVCREFRSLKTNQQTLCPFGSCSGCIMLLER